MISMTEAARLQAHLKLKKLCSIAIQAVIKIGDVLVLKLA